MSRPERTPGTGTSPPDLLAPDAAADENTLNSRKRTLLSIERSFLSFERTLMAWLKTSLSMISFGFTLVKFFQYLEQQRGDPVVGVFGHHWAPTTFGIAMVVVGTGAMVLAIVQHRRRVEALRLMGLVPQWNLALNVAVIVVALGVFALATLAASG